MNKQMNILTGSVIVFVAAGLVGCGQGFKSTGTSSDSAKSINIDNELAKAEAANNEAQQAMADAAEALKAIQDSSGNINLGLFVNGGSSSTSEVQTSGLLTPVIDKLRTTFDTVFSKVDDVKAKFADARNSLLVALSRLDHNNPAQAYMISQIMTQLNRIDQMEQQFRAQLQTLTGKLDTAVVALRKVISGATSFIPGWGFVVDFAIDYFVMSDIENFITEIKMRLLSI